MSQDTPETATDDRGETAAPVAAPPAEERGEPAAAAAPPAERPADVPEKFWDAATGALRTDALVKSYAELERKLSLLTQGGDGAALSDGARARLLELLGRPGSADGYRIEPPHGLIEPDPELNARLHEAGFTQAQAQMVYELAAERLLPAVSEVVGELDAQRQLDRLRQHFGGPEAWSGASRQIRAWAEGNLDPEVYATLASSCDGVIALHRMMQAAEPSLLDGPGGGGAGELDEQALGEMVRDPRYWRQRDPDFVARVTEGFRKLYAR
jgi:hypothetical protein